MSRYVEADALKANCYIMVGDTTIGRRDYVTFHEIDSAPSIDIVFCKECKYEPICNHRVQHTTHDAHSVTIASKTVEWCSCGEREE